jgi:hypothetical protein
MKQRLQRVLNWRRGESKGPEPVWQAPGDNPDIGYEAATPYLSSQPGELYEPQPRTLNSFDSGSEPVRL